VQHPVKQLSTLLVALAVLATTSASAAGRQNLLTLHRSVIAFVTEQHPADADLLVTPDRLDPRLNLSPCTSPLIAFWARGSAKVGHTTVGVRCEDAKPWKLYLPTRVKLMQPVVVALRPLARGQQLERSDLGLDKRDVGTLRSGALQDPEQVLGYVLKRAVPAGHTLDLRLLEAPRLVERGRRVRLIIAGQGINITMSGTALEDGALGETVRVRNPASRRVVEGIVMGPARVRLPAPYAM